MQDAGMPSLVMSLGFDSYLYALFELIVPNNGVICAYWLSVTVAVAN